MAYPRDPNMNPVDVDPVTRRDETIYETRRRTDGGGGGGLAVALIVALAVILLLFWIF